MHEELLDEQSTTPTGKTGIQDMKNTAAHRGQGHVADALSASPGTGEHSQAVESERLDSGPTYERGQGIVDARHHTLRASGSQQTHQGEKMQDNVDNQNRTSHQAVDGFSDTEGKTDIDSPDPGVEPKNKPLDPDEYAKAQREARSEDQDT